MASEVETAAGRVLPGQRDLLELARGFLTFLSGSCDGAEQKHGVQGVLRFPILPLTHTSMSSVVPKSFFFK